MRCLECGYQNDDSVSTCSKCGTVLVPSSKIRKPEPPPTKEVSDNPESKISGNPTIKGTPINMPAWDEPETHSPKTVKNQAYFTCEGCNYYPLKEEVSAEHPCPNCGNTGKEVRSESKHSGTMKLGDIQMGEPVYLLSLKEESGDIRLSTEEGELLVNRENIDPSNKAISSEKHARITLEKGEVFLEDESSNKATFIQVSGKVKLENGARIILGNKMYQISVEEK